MYHHTRYPHKPIRLFAGSIAQKAIDTTAIKTPLNVFITRVFNADNYPVQTVAFSSENAWSVNPLHTRYSPVKSPLILYSGTAFASYERCFSNYFKKLVKTPPPTPKESSR